MTVLCTDKNIASEAYFSCCQSMSPQEWRLEAQRPTIQKIINRRRGCEYFTKSDDQDQHHAAAE